MIRWNYEKYKGYDTKVIKNGIEYYAYIRIIDDNSDGLFDVWVVDNVVKSYSQSYLDDGIVLHAVLPPRNITKVANKILKEAGFTAAPGFDVFVLEALAYIVDRMKGG